VPALHPAFPLLLTLLTSLSVLAQPPGEPWEPGVRHLELLPNAPAQEHELRLAPGLALTVLFDTPLRQDGVELEDAEHFLWGLDASGRILTLVLSREVRWGRRLRLRVHFKDAGVPASADFLLVVHPARAETQVQVYRQSRSAESCCQEAEAEREKRQQCQVALARTRAECTGKGGLLGLAADGLLDEDEGVRARSPDIRTLTEEPASALRLRDTTTFRARVQTPAGEEKRVRVAVQLKLLNPDTRDWTAEGGQVVTRGGVRSEVGVWQPAPLRPGEERGVVWVEAELTEEEARGRFTLKLWDAGGTRTFSVEGVTFP
jgi:uncharacterized protein (TIGR02268 family)